MDDQNREGSSGEKNTAELEEEETQQVFGPSLDTQNATLFLDPTLINGQRDSLAYDPHMIVSRDAPLHDGSHALNHNHGQQQPQQQESEEMEEEIPGIQ